MSTGLFAWIEKRKIEGRERKQAVQLACSPLRRRLQEWCCVESKSWTASYSQSFLWQVPLVKKSERKKEWTSRRFRKGKVNFVFMSPADRNRQIEWSGNKKQTHFYLDRRKLKVASTRRLLATATPLHSTAVHSTATAASLSLSPLSAAVVGAIRRDTQLSTSANHTAEIEREARVSKVRFLISIL